MVCNSVYRCLWMNVIKLRCTKNPVVLVFTKDMQDYTVPITQVKKHSVYLFCRERETDCLANFFVKKS